MYMLLDSIDLVTALHHFTPGQVRSKRAANNKADLAKRGTFLSETGFVSICRGAMIGQLTDPLQDMVLARKSSSKGPEARLHGTYIAAVLFPIGCFHLFVKEEDGVKGKLTSLIS